MQNAAAIVTKWSKGVIGVASQSTRVFDVNSLEGLQNTFKWLNTSIAQDLGDKRMLYGTETSGFNPQNVDVDELKSEYVINFVYVIVYDINDCYLY